jgi:hypothetical protein
MSTRSTESKSVNISSRPARTIHFLSCTVTGDNSSLFQYDAETTHTEQEVENKITTTTTAQNVLLAKVKDQNAYHIFFINMVSMHKEFVTEGETVNSTYRCWKGY